MSPRGPGIALSRTCRTGGPRGARMWKRISGSTGAAACRAGNARRRSAPRSTGETGGSAFGAPYVNHKFVYDRTMPVEAKQLESGVAVITISGRLALGGETERLDAAIKGMLQKDVKKFVLDITAL